MHASSLALGAAAALLLAPAHADPSLLNAAQQAQITAWMGQGDFHLNTIYSLHTGDGAAQFHAAADGKGKTLTVMEVSGNGLSWRVGGFNPQSWDSSEKWHETQADRDRIGFLFNLNNGKVYHQVPRDFVLPSQGLRQTWNSARFGPCFGEGGDLWVEGTMQVVYSWLFTYGDPGRQGTSLMDGSMSDPHPVRLHLDSLEVYQVLLVPEPASAWLLLAGLPLLLRLRHR